MYRIIMNKKKIGLWKFYVLSGNNMTILTSKTYFRKVKCRETGERFAKAVGLEWEEKNGKKRKRK